jgi:hypothetical protein
VDQGFLWGALGTLEWLKELLQREREQAVEAEVDGNDRVELELDPQRFVTRPEGRRAWLREGRRALEAQRERERRPIAGGRADRLFEACRAWSRSSMPTGPPTPPTSTGARTASPPTGRGGWHPARSSRSTCPTCRLG